MENKKEPSWECPLCTTCFDKNGIAGLINKFEILLANKAECPPDHYEGMDYKVFELKSMIQDLKSIHKQYIRKPTRMMEAQNAIAQNEKLINQGEIK